MISHHSKLQILAGICKLKAETDETLHSYLTRVTRSDSARGVTLPFPLPAITPTAGEYPILNEVLGKKFSKEFEMELEMHAPMRPLLVIDSVMRGADSAFVILTCAEEPENKATFYHVVSNYLRGMASPCCIHNTKRGRRIVAFPFKNILLIA